MPQIRLSAPLWGEQQGGTAAATICAAAVAAAAAKGSAAKPRGPSGVQTARQRKAPHVAARLLLLRPKVVHWDQQWTSGPLPNGHLLLLLEAGGQPLEKRKRILKMGVPKAKK